jgi:signal transduction histidine kinase
MRAALAEGADSARTAVRELRDLANGLHPAALADGGLTAALDDMARHSPVPLRLHVQSGRLDPGVEFTAWSVIGEAVVNAQKHAAAHGIEVDVGQQNGDLRLRVRDDGHGGANPDGPGLRGLRDRVEAAHGRLTVTSSVGGTTVEAVLPCGS